LNDKDHAIEAGLKIPSVPLCFAKFTSSLSGPFDPIQLHGLAESPIECSEAIEMTLDSQAAVNL